MAEKSTTLLFHGTFGHPVYDEFYEVTEREGRCTQSASGGEGKTASISSFYVTPMREQQAK